MQLILTSEDKADFKPYHASWCTEDTTEKEVSGKQSMVPSLYKTVVPLNIEELGNLPD